MDGAMRRPRLFIFGLGYTAQVIAAGFCGRGLGSRLHRQRGTLAFDDAGTVRMALADADHVLSSVPPGGEGGDPVLERYGDALAGKPLAISPPPGSMATRGGRLGRRKRADRHRPPHRAGRGRCRWLAMGARVLRLPGIYGPGRSALDRVREGRAHRIDLPDRCSAGSMSTTSSAGVSPRSMLRRGPITWPTTCRAARTR
jgi:hypothetical protein